MASNECRRTQYESIITQKGEVGACLEQLVKRVKESI